MNQEILKATIEFLKRYERFNGALFGPFLKMLALMVLTFYTYFSFFILDLYAELTLSSM